MSDNPAQAELVKPARKRWWRMALGLPMLLVVLGLIAEVGSGLGLSRHTSSLPIWLAAMLGLGAVGLIGEAVGEWIWANDKVTDPLPRRVLRLVGALALWGLSIIVAVWVAGAIVL